MKKLLPLIFLFTLIQLSTSKMTIAQNNDAVWKYLNSNERDKAYELLEPKLKNKSITNDEFIIYNLLKTFDGNESAITNFLEYIRKVENPDPYIYALWFNEAVAGSYGYKEPHQLDLLNYLINTKPGNGTLRAAAHYNLAHHYARINQFKKVIEEDTKIEALCDWQFTGPFNNISGSGFNKNYPPVKIASNDSVFSSYNNAPIKWYTPVAKSTEGWQLTDNFISGNDSRIIYAQTFVNSPVEQEVIFCTGFAGNFKAWLNDQLIMNVPTEMVTEMDAYNNKCVLKKGYNRIVIQVGSDNLSPNFIVRLTDADYNSIQKLTSTAQPQSYQNTESTELKGSLPLFAENYFSEKIRTDSFNLTNYLLLSKTYLRNKKVFEARKTIETALTYAPENSLLKYELLLCYIKEDNRTGISEIYEYFKQHDKNSLIGYLLRVSELKNQQKYQDALDLTSEMLKHYVCDESIYDDRIQLLAELGNVPQMILLINEASAKYPNYDKFANYQFNIEKTVNKNSKKALKILENYLSKHYSFDLLQLLIEEYYNNNNTTEPYKRLNALIEYWPHDPTLRETLLNQYVNQQRYKEAYEISKFILLMKPYSGYYYQLKGNIEEAMNDANAAIKSYQSAILYEPTMYDARDKLRSLQNKKPLLDAVAPANIDDLISKTGKNIDAKNFDYYFLLWDNAVVLYPEGGREEIHYLAIKVLNQRGIDEYKDFSIKYNQSTETISIEEAQLIKPNGRKTKPEINNNRIVWTGLAPDDIVYCKYKIKSYLAGKFSQEYYDKQVFSGFIPFESSRYCIIVPSSKQFNYKVLNGDVPLKKSEIENYTVYSWEKNIISVLKEEPLMPPSDDFAPTLHISTLNNWNEIAQWYSDIVYSKIDNDYDYEISEVYKTLFGNKTNLTSDEKANIIYNYIENNINYSSVSFRQSAIIPQNASKTIVTRLGDCKDISTLFVSLANLCGLKSNLVLVSTRDNGIKDMFLPSFQFNHCIVKYIDEKNKEHYLELTDRDLPFKSLPANLYGAMSLTIPSKDDRDSKYNLMPIMTEERTRDRSIVNSKINISGNDISVNLTNIKYGNLCRGTRSIYRSLSEENVIKKKREAITQQFDNPVTINKVSFIALDENTDSVTTITDFSVTSEVKKVGSLSVFKIPYQDEIFTSAAISLNERSTDIEYWNYENADEYISTIEISLPNDKVFQEIPEGTTLSFKKSRYNISFKKLSPNKILVSRKVNLVRDNITPSEYKEFKSFASKIIEIEDAYLSFK